MGQGRKEMGKTYTDFSQLSKGMFKKSDPVVEVKPLPPKKAAGDDALAYFGIGGTGNGEQGTARLWGAPLLRLPGGLANCA